MTIAVKGLNEAALAESACRFHAPYSIYHDLHCIFTVQKLFGMKKIIVLFLCIVMTYSIPSTAQINNTLLENLIVLNDSMQESVGISVYSNTFFKNNEYFDKIAEGYTLFGTQLRTELFYTLNKHVKLQAGVYARKDFGNDNFTKVAPVLSVKIQKNGYSVIMGTLEGNVAHQLAEPIYNYERLILNHLENGLQIKADRKKIWADTWINWEVQQYLNSTFQEQLSVGHSSKTTLYENKKGWQIKLPVQFLVTHQGGQIDVDTNSLKTLANAATGIIIQYTNTNASAFIKSVTSENYVTYFNDLSPSKTLNFKEGSAMYANVNVTSKYDIGVSAGYWSGMNYLAPRGGDLFKSEASIYGQKGYTEPNRNLLFLRLLYQRRIFDALNVDVRFEPYFDLNNDYFAYSYSVYFTYKKDLTFFNLTNGKRRSK